MSYSFQTDSTTLWDPALRVGQLYLGQAEVAARLVEVPSGLTPRRDGYCDLDPKEFATFVERLLRFYNRGRHATLSHLLRGILLISLVLLKRAGGQLLSTDGQALDALLTEAAGLEHTMNV
ncbi:DUF6086 family protein [Salinispora arenicola]|uniref:DUF6086 family protein n=1 Tax=Salinispora arenicola TaxID=168697 RepID=UPI0003810C4B|nr:DUF6086 family protein [Salinispora arenicola]